MSTPGEHLVHTVDVADDVLEHGANVLGADEHRLGAGERLCAPARELGPAAHRVLELRAVCLHRVARTARAADGAAEEHVVREDEVGRLERAERLCVGLDVRLALSAA